MPISVVNASMNSLLPTRGDAHEVTRTSAMGYSSASLGPPVMKNTSHITHTQITADTNTIHVHPPSDRPVSALAAPAMEYNPVNKAECMVRYKHVSTLNHLLLGQAHVNQKVNRCDGHVYHNPRRSAVRCKNIHEQYIVNTCAAVLAALRDTRMWEAPDMPAHSEKSIQMAEREKESGRVWA